LWGLKNENVERAVGNEKLHFAENVTKLIAMFFVVGKFTACT